MKFLLHFVNITTFNRANIHRPVESHSGARENIAGPYNCHPPPRSVFLEIERPSRGRKRGERCSLHQTRGSGERRKLPQWHFVPCHYVRDSFQMASF